MLLYLEGLDRTGKTTFGTRLAMEQGWPYLQRRYPAPGLLRGLTADYFLGGHVYTLHAYAAFQRADPTATLIVDRSLVSEYAFADVYGRGLTEEKMDFWLRMLPKAARFLLFVVPYEIYVERHSQGEGQVPLDELTFNAVSTTYQAFFANFPRQSWRMLSGVAPYGYQLKDCVDILDGVRA